MRLIDADALYEKVDESQAHNNHQGIAHSVHNAEHAHFKFMIHQAPTIDPEVRHGRWIPTEYDSYADGAPVWDKWECSECGHEHKGEEDTLTPFCPNCGARMDGGADNG